MSCDPRDYIDWDEGREIDWDSHFVEPFYAEALPCESCGSPVSERRPAIWDEELLVGGCCFNAPRVPDMPSCPGLIAALISCDQVGKMSDAVQAHKRNCAACGGLRKGVGAEIRGERKERAA
jgi:ribosomal protein L37E